MLKKVLIGLAVLIVLLLLSGYVFRDALFFALMANRIALDHDFSDSIMGYVSISQGFRSGIYNGRPTATAQISVADPETLTSYEIGLKTQLWDRRLQINGSAFYDDYKDQQFLVNRQHAQYLDVRERHVQEETDRVRDAGAP